MHAPRQRAKQRARSKVGESGEAPTRAAWSWIFLVGWRGICLGFMDLRLRLQIGKGLGMDQVCSVGWNKQLLKILNIFLYYLRKNVYSQSTDVVHKGFRGVKLLIKR